MTDSTEIVIVLDRSGSMQTIARDMEGAFDALIADQLKTPGVCHVTLTQFDTLYESVYSGVALHRVPPLKLDPRGGTALLDALGRTISETGARLATLAESARPGRVVVVVITDGEENSSKEYSRAKVFGMIKHQRERYAWEFLFLGANQDAIKAAADMGIANAVNFKASTNGSVAAGQAVSFGLRSYRAGVKMDAMEIQANYNAIVDDLDAKDPKGTGTP